MPGYVLAKLVPDRRCLSPRQEHPQGHRLPRLQRQAPADFRPRGRALFRRPRCRRRRAQEAHLGRLRDRRFGQGQRRPFRQLHRRGGRARFREEPRQGLGFDLRPGDSGRAGLRGSRTVEVSRQNLTSSTRRLRARASSLVPCASGRVAPKPAVFIRAGQCRRRSIRRAQSRRAPGSAAGCVPGVPVSSVWPSIETFRRGVLLHQLDDLVHGGPGRGAQARAVVIEFDIDRHPAIGVER